MSANTITSGASTIARCAVGSRCAANKGSALQPTGVSASSGSEDSDESASSASVYCVCTKATAPPLAVRGGRGFGSARRAASSATMCSRSGTERWNMSESSMPPTDSAAAVPQSTVSTSTAEPEDGSTATDRLGVCRTSIASVASAARTIAWTQK